MPECFSFVLKVGLAVGDIDSVKKRAATKKITLQVLLLMGIAM